MGSLDYHFILAFVQLDVRPADSCVGVGLGVADQLAVDVQLG
jgi:hypothetical protein